MAELIKEGGELAASITKAIKERLASPVWGVFLISWIVIHWRVVYVSLFISNDSIIFKKGMMKDEYIHHLLFSNDYYLSFLPSFISNLLHNLFWPAIVTYLCIWILPKYVFIPAFKKDYGDHIEKKKYKTDQDTKLEESKVKQLKVEVERAIEEKKVAEEDPTSFWNEEYLGFRDNSVYFNDLNSLVKIIYENDGYITGMQNKRIINTKALALFDSMNLINFKGGDKISLTEKGKYFIGRLDQGIIDPFTGIPD